MDHDEHFVADAERRDPCRADLYFWQVLDDLVVQVSPILGP
jgi:hypothetical protein